jgi:multisubunit Na+/H+ antiporter MnhG subunit
VITTKRTTPLTAAVDEPAHGAHGAHDAVAAEAAELESSVVPVVAHQLSGQEQQQRDDRFSDGVRTLRVGGASVQLSERILLVLAGIIAPLGLVVVLLGYLGVANSPYVFEQNSYLISGGIFGLALVFLGAFFYFAHWMTQLVREHRVQSVAMLEAIQRLQDEVTRQGEGRASSSGSSNGHDPDALVLVATQRGTMAHEPGCVVVAGKTDLREVDATDGLTPCKLCEPF